MPSITLLKRNPLSYPSRRPGFDPSHPAYLYSQIGTISQPYIGVCSGEQYFDVQTGKPYNMNATYNGTLKIGSSIGPFVDMTSVGTNYYSFSVPITPSWCAAAIFTMTAAQSASYGNIISWSTYGVYARSTGALIFYRFGDQSLGVPTLVVGDSYFVAVTNGSLQTNHTDIVVTNLRTGRIYPTTIGGATNLTSASTGYFGSDASSEVLNGGLHCFMFSNACPTQTQMMQWAQDPWSFWYPRQTDVMNLLSNAVTVAPPGPSSFVPGAMARIWKGPFALRTSAPFTSALSAQPSGVAATGGTLPFMGVG